MPNRVIWDPGTGQALFTGWALPGADPASPEWLIGQPVYSGNELIRTDPANGSGAFDQAWDDREGLTYIENQAVAWTSVYRDLLVAIAAPGTTFDVGVALIAGSVDVIANGILLEFVASGPSGNEYAIAGTEVEIGYPVQPGEKLRVRVHL